MSVEQEKLVWESAHRFGATKRFVLLALANHSDPAGNRCFPSLKRLMFITELGNRKIRRALAELEAESLVTPFRDDEGHHAFALTLAGLAKVSKVAPAAMATQAKKVATQAKPPHPLKGVTASNNQRETFAVSSLRDSPPEVESSLTPPYQERTPTAAEVLTGIPPALQSSLFASDKSRQNLPASGKLLTSGREPDVISPKDAPFGLDNPQILGTFPCDGKQQTWGFTAIDVEVWASHYPALDIPDQLRRAHAWILSNPGKRKTYRGMPSFLNGWFGRAQNNTGGNNAHANGTFRPIYGTRSANNATNAERYLSRMREQEGEHSAGPHPRVGNQ